MSVKKNASKRAKKTRSRRKDRRTGEIAEIAEGSTYEVASPSGGKTYTVKYCGSGDGDPEYVALWSCTCPAKRFGNTDDRGMCKHEVAVANWVLGKQTEQGA